ncbi:MAG: ABC transporter substrate-binding protein [Oscillospiraceae bacterium]|nr:ABC transporter substrate-binding protein [Oscillospiraceae bacterium]
MLLIPAAAMLLGAVSCGKAENISTAAPPDAGASAETRVVTDGLGREVEVPVKIERIVTLGNATRILVYLGLEDRMVSTANGDVSENVLQAYGIYHQERWKTLPVVASGGYGEVNTEAILEADPDIILCTYEEDIVNGIEEQLGRKVVAAPQGKLFQPDFEEAVRIFGEACGVPERAEEVLAYLHVCLDDLAARTGGIPEAERPSVLAAAATSRTAHGISTVYANSAILAALGVKDVTKGLANGPKGLEVDREQILEWDPDFIILDAGNVYLVRAEYEEDPEYFSRLTAVNEGRLYQWPNSSANYTNVEIPLASAYYTGCLLYPEAFADVDPAAKAEEIYEFFLGRGDYRALLEENGLGFAEVRLNG